MTVLPCTASTSISQRVRFCPGTQPSLPARKFRIRFWNSFGPFSFGHKPKSGITCVCTVMGAAVNLLGVYGTAVVQSRVTAAAAPLGRRSVFHNQQSELHLLPKCLGISQKRSLQPFCRDHFAEAEWSLRSNACRPLRLRLRLSPLMCKKPGRYRPL
jgi:hypothetical protein